MGAMHEGPQTLERPTFLASHGVRLAAVVLPSSDLRDRYRHEFVAELYGMGRAHQMTYATRVLLSAWTLRRAITTSPHERVAEESGMTTNEAPAPFRCRFNLRHRWVYRWTEEGVRYRQCARCGKDDHRSNGPADGIWAVGA